MSNEDGDKIVDLNPSTGRVLGLVDGSGMLLSENEAVEGGVFNVLVNLGQEHGVKVGARVLVFALGPEMTDPETSEPLGHFEIIRGEGKVSSTQTRMSIVTSTRTVPTKVRRAQPVNAILAGMSAEYDIREQPAPFRSPKKDDLIRFI